MSLADLKYHRQIAKKEHQITPKSFQPRFSQASRIHIDGVDISQIRDLRLNNCNNWTKCTSDDWILDPCQSYL